ncbi:uncharacterized protein LOC121754790 [Salvia splendens]|uniref:uncharacterized protein LOC121754790 n=1 Tax=Salvia splendens TaxID=180675 RepID=UPI001C2693BD|nr:uncharacterized protein LOC121754790 [Salvia splendens]
MRTYFMSQSLWDIVDKGYTIPEDLSALSTTDRAKFNKEMEKDNLALYSLQMAMAESIFPRISGAQTSKEAWDILKEEYHGSEKVRHLKLQTLRRDLENMTMKESETLKDYYTRLREIVNQLKAYGEPITDTRVVEKILITLPGKFDPIVTTTEETKDLSKLSVTELIGSLEAYEKRLSMRQDEPAENAFQSKLNVRSQNSHIRRKIFEEKKKKNESCDGGKKKYSPCGICKKTSHLEKDCWFKNKPQCKNCEKFGHEVKDCRLHKKYQASFSEENECEENIFYACHVASEVKNEAWFIDSGCSNHMTGDEKQFRDIHRTIKSQVKLGNGELVDVDCYSSFTFNIYKF